MLLNNKEHNIKLLSTLGKYNIEWHLNSPRRVIFLGYGRVQLTKYHLWRVIREQKLTFEELYNPLAQIESCLNSRPITSMSSNPVDLSPLTFFLNSFKFF